MMKLILTNEEGDAKEFVLDRPITEIGRRSGNDIQLSGRDVSGLHALIESDGQRHTLVDRDSTNGTWLNGNRLTQPLELTAGTALRIGKWNISVREMAGSPVALPALADGEDEQIDQPSSGTALDTANIGSDGAVALNGVMADGIASDGVATNGNAQITIHSGIKAGSTIDIVKAVTTVGRPGVQVVAINRQADGYYALHVETLQCNDKATVNDQELEELPVKLGHGDTLRVAGTEIRFEFKAAG